MQKSDPSDPELLAEWLEQRREPAFRALVSRYAGLVLMTARRTCGDDSIAAEASQLTFLLLARKARSLLTCASLGGWLHRATLMHSRNLLRSADRENRKRQSLQVAMESTPSQPSPDLWADLQPLLDESLAALSELDREAILLRFYRSLSVREVAGTLGIATDAAQKRIDRATARLRDQLTRRGCQAGGSFAAIMLAGFASDVQAAAPLATALASDALAAGAAPASGFLTAATAKTTSLVTPLVVVVAAGAWIVSQRQSIARLEQQNASFQQHLAAGPAIASSSRKPVKDIWDQRPINWQEIAIRLQRSPGAGGYLQTTLREEDGFRALSRDELVSSIDEVEAAKLSERDRSVLMDHLIPALRDADPEYVLKRFKDNTALGKWAERDPEKALAWFDEQLAQSRFAGKKENGLRELDGVVQMLTSALISSDPAGAMRVFSILPESQRIEAIQFTAWRAKKQDHASWAELFRKHLPEKDRLNAITWPMTELGEGGTLPYAEASDYLDRIGATPEERRACILGYAGRTRFPGAFSRPPQQNLDALRDWVGTEEPELVGPATIAAVRGLLSVRPYPQVVDIALHYHEAGVGDEMLLPLLERYRIEEHPELTRRLAEKLSDKALREDFLLKTAKPSPGR